MRPSIKSDLVKLAAYYEKTLSPEQIQIYSEQLSQNLTDDECSMACRIYINDPNNEWFPKPVSKLIAIIKAPISNEDLSQSITSFLVKAHSDFGSHWQDGFFQNGDRIFQGKDCAYTTWENAAISVFGETGLRVVQRYGNWKNFCEALNENPDGVFRAQVGKLATSLQNIVQKTGSFDSLPERREQDQLMKPTGLLGLLKSKEIPE